MGILDEMFDPAFVFDNETAQRRDIEVLKTAVATAPDAVRLVVPLERKLEKLELLVKAMCELLLTKKVVTTDELSVMMQRLDLADGTEDGRMSEQARRHAPQCGRCGRYVNPQRTACIYCGAAIGAAAAAQTVAPRVVTCPACQAQVDEAETYFTDEGLRCQTCYDGAGR